MMESFATPYPCIFYDGEQEVDKGHVGVHSVLTFKRFQAQVAAKTGHPAGSLSAVLVCTRTTGDTTKKQKLPINENTNFNIILNQHNPSRERDAHFLVSLKKSKKERKTGGAGVKKRASETETVDEEDATSARDENEPCPQDASSALPSPEASPIHKGGAGSPGGSLRSPQPMSSPVSVLPPLANNSQRSKSDLGMMGKTGSGGGGSMQGGGGKGDKGTAAVVGGKRDLADMTSSATAPSSATAHKSSWQSMVSGSQRHQKGGPERELQGSLESGRNVWGADRSGPSGKNAESMIADDDDDDGEVRGRVDRQTTVVQVGAAGSSMMDVVAGGSAQAAPSPLKKVGSGSPLMKLSNGNDYSADVSKSLPVSLPSTAVSQPQRPSSISISQTQQQQQLNAAEQVVPANVSGSVAVIARLAAARASAGVVPGVAPSGVMGKGSGTVGTSTHQPQQQQQGKIAFGAAGLDPAFRAPLQPHVQQQDYASSANAFNDFRSISMASSNGAMATERSHAMMKAQQQHDQILQRMMMMMPAEMMMQHGGGGGALKENGAPLSANGVGGGGGGMEMSGKGQQQVNKGCRFCNFCKERKIVPSFHGCVEDKVVQGFRGPSPAGPIGRPGTGRVEAAA